MDHFHEEIVFKRNRTFNVVLTVLLMLGMLVFAVFAFIGLMQIMRLEFYIINIALTLLCAGAAYGCFVLRKYQTVEYEYTFTNGEMDFAKVVSNEKRVTLGTSKTQDFIAFAPVTDESFARYASTPEITTLNMCLNKDVPHYFLFDNGTGGSGKRLFIMEPSEKMVSLICQYHPRSAIK